MADQSYFKVIASFVFSWIFAQQLAAQPTFLKNHSYDSVQNLAKQHDRPMFLVVHRRGEQFSPFTEVSISQKTKDILHDQFVSGVVWVSRDDINHPILKAYSLNTPIYLFTDKDGYPLLRFNKPIKQEDTLVRLIDSAKTIAAGETMGKLVQQYKKGFRSPSLLRKLLEQYQTFDQYTDLQVLNDYISQLTVQELNNFETVVFLLSCGPVYNSQTYHLTRTNRKMVDSLYATLPLPTRKEINGRITRRTFREALDKQDYSLSQNLGLFAAQTWQPNYVRAQIGRGLYSMEYKRLFRDTSAYIAMARNYYNQNFYHVEPDSLAKLDFAHNRKKNMRRGKQTLDSVENKLFQRWIAKSRRRYKEEQAISLSYGARQLLDFGQDNPEALFDAIRWQQKAIALKPEYGQYHHTLAQLLYRVGFYAEAAAEQQRAVRLYKPNKPRHKQMREVLKQMQSRSF